MPSASATISPTVFFVTAGGRAQVYDDGAVFYPAHGSATVRTNAGPRLNSTQHPILRQQDVDAIMELIRQTSGGKLNPAQSETLSRMLAAPDQQLIALNGPADAQTIGISGAGPQPGRYLLVGFAGGSLLLAPNGQPLLAGDSVPGVSMTACIGMMVMAMVGLGMAIWLLVLSRRLLKQTLLTNRLHQRYAMAKVVTSLVAAIFFGWMIDTFAGSRPGADPSSHAGISVGIVLGAIGCAFPAFLWMMFRKRSARLYFDGVM